MQRAFGIQALGTKDLNFRMSFIAHCMPPLCLQNTLTILDDHADWRWMIDLCCHSSIVAHSRPRNIYEYACKIRNGPVRHSNDASSESTWIYRIYKSVMITISYRTLSRMTFQYFLPSFLSLNRNGISSPPSCSSPFSLPLPLCTTTMFDYSCRHFWPLHSHCSFFGWSWLQPFRKWFRIEQPRFDQLCCIHISIVGFCGLWVHGIVHHRK